MCDCLLYVSVLGASHFLTLIVNSNKPLCFYSLTCCQLASCCMTSCIGVDWVVMCEWLHVPQLTQQIPLLSRCHSIGCESSSMRTFCRRGECPQIIVAVVWCAPSMIVFPWWLCLVIGLFFTPHIHMFWQICFRMMTPSAAAVASPNFWAHSFVLCFVFLDQPESPP
jgi:hypothetical protein